MSSFTHFPYLLPVATKWELQQSMHCPLSQCCHSFLFSPSERTKWRSKKDPQILELEGLRGLRVLGNKKRSDFYPKIRYFCFKNFFLSPRMAEIRQFSFWWKYLILIGRLCIEATIENKMLTAMWKSLEKTVSETGSHLVFLNDQKNFRVYICKSN